jgi:chitinase
MQSIYHNYLWQASYWTQNNTPTTGGSGPWNIVGYCGSMPGQASNALFAPYVDVTMNYPLAANASQVGNHYTLAFIIDSGGCTASWAGTIPLSSNLYVSDVATIRSNGGDVVASFGGAAGNELATTCSSASALQAQYQKVITQYGLKRIDFDVEGGAISNTSATSMRDTVIAALQAANPGLQVSFTLPALPNGLTSQGVALLQDAIAKGVNISTVNVMAMDFGSAYDNGGQMGLSALYTAWSTMEQLELLYPSLSHAQVADKVGVTPMIGQNDNSTEVFTLANASYLLSNAQQNGIGFLSFWSETRDTPCPAGTPATPALGTCSGISMNQFAFGNIFKGF